MTINRSVSFGAAMRFHFRGFAAVSLFALASAQPALAQITADAAAESDDIGTGEILVTAQRREEKLQSVPLTVNVVTADTLEKGGIRNLRDLSYLTPGLTINSTGAEYLVTPTIRGVVSLGGGTGVTIFQDGIPTGSSTTNLNMLDVARVEVIKGPVAALYGEGAYMGAINYVTKRPGDIFTGTMRAGVVAGDNGHVGYNVSAYVAGPIIADVLSLGFAANLDKYPQLITDDVSGVSRGGYMKRDFRATMSFKPSSNFDIFASVYYGNDDFDVTPGEVALNNCGAASTSAVTLGESTRYCGKLKYKAVELASDAGGVGATGNSRHYWVGNLIMTLDLDFATLASYTGYTNGAFNRFNDFGYEREGIPFPRNPGPGTVLLREYYGQDTRSDNGSTELRLTSRQDQRFRWVIGGYYSKNFGGVNSSPVSIDGSVLPAGVTISGSGLPYLTTTGQSVNVRTGYTKAHSYAGFIGADLDIVTGLTASGEFREGRNRSSSIFLLNGAANGTSSNRTNERSWRGTVKYQVMPQVMVYGMVGQGEKPGGVNSTATIEAERQYDPERNRTYELGIKTSIGRAAQINLSLFKVTTSGFQASGPSQDPANAALITQNIGGSVSNGFEVDALLVPTKGMRVNIGVAYADPQFKNGTIDYSRTYCRTTTPCVPRLVTTVAASGTTRYGMDLSGLQLPRTSQYTISTGVEFNGTVGDGFKWYGRTDFRFETKQFVDPTNLAWGQDRFITNLGAGVSKGPYSVSAFVNNLLDNDTPETAVSVTYLNDFNTRLVGYLPMPRTYGINLEYKF